jgi:hypothetical protein
LQKTIRTTLIAEFEIAFFEHLKTDGVEIRPYLGEFDDTETMNDIIGEGKNIIFYSLNGDEWLHLNKKRAEYSFYFVGTTVSENAFYRQKMRNDLIELIEATDAKFLNFKNVPTSLYPTAKTLKKIKDNFTEFGYLIIYERVFNVEFEVAGEATYAV